MWFEADFHETEDLVHVLDIVVGWAVSVRVFLVVEVLQGLQVHSRVN
jgi:hypothetical protein